jgi:ATP-dependent Clp protease ATP-binding subunit ClpA
MFERFAGQAREAVITALNEARHSGTNQIGCEHLLIALASAGSGSADSGSADNVAAETLTAAGLSPNRLRSLAATGPNPPTDTLDADALAAIGIDLDAVRRAAENAFGPGSLDRPSLRRNRPGRTKMTADAKRALELAVRAARRRGVREVIPSDQHRSQHREITSGHLLLGILDQGHNRALTLLTSADVQPAELRADLTRRMAA